VIAGGDRVNSLAVAPRTVESNRRSVARHDVGGTANWSRSPELSREQTTARRLRFRYERSQQLVAISYGNMPNHA